MMAFYLFVACVIMQIVFTWRYPAAPVKSGNAQLYWSSPGEPLTRPGWKGPANYKFLSVMLVLVMVVLFYLFR
jgi:SSS family solute:Na+ symporter